MLHGLKDGLSRLLNFIFGAGSLGDDLALDPNGIARDQSQSFLFQGVDAALNLLALHSEQFVVKIEFGLHLLVLLDALLHEVLANTALPGLRRVEEPLDVLLVSFNAL